MINWLKQKRITFDNQLSLPIIFLIIICCHWQKSYFILDSFMLIRQTKNLTYNKTNKKTCCFSIPSADPEIKRR